MFSSNFRHPRGALGILAKKNCTMYRPLYNNAEKFQIYKKFPWFLACSLFEGNAQLRPIIYLFVSPRSASQLHIRFGLTETQPTWPNRFLMCVCVVFVLCLCCFLYSVIFIFFCCTISCRFFGCLYAFLFFVFFGRACSYSAPLLLQNLMFPH